MTYFEIRNFVGQAARVVGVCYIVALPWLFKGLVFEDGMMVPLSLFFTALGVLFIVTFYAVYGEQRIGTKMKFPWMVALALNIPVTIAGVNLGIIDKGPPAVPHAVAAMIGGFALVSYFLNLLGGSVGTKAKSGGKTNEEVRLNG